MAISDNDVDLNRRVLIIDDNPAIHDDFRKILCRATNTESLAEDEAAIFGSPGESSEAVMFELDSALQGQEGLEKVRAACGEGRPYALAFVDVRMPPGWDGVETISRIWKACPELQVIICTAYSDYSWDEIFREVGQSDSLLILKKPFDNVEVLQMAHAMTRKWALNQQARDHLGRLNRVVKERTIELRDANDGLVRVNRQLETAVERANKHARDAEAANRGKNSLLAELGREVHGSLAATMRLTQQLIASSLNEQQRHQAEAIRLNCQALVEFATRVIKISDVEPATLEGEETTFQVGDVIQQVVSLHTAGSAPAPPSIKVELDDAVPARVVGDSFRLRHVLSNLVEGCLQRNGAGPIRITIRETESGSGTSTIRFCVADEVSDLTITGTDAGASSCQPDASLSTTVRLVESLGGQFGCQRTDAARIAYWLRVPFKTAPVAPAAPVPLEKVA